MAVTAAPQGVVRPSSVGIDTIRVMLRVSMRFGVEDRMRGYDLGTMEARWTPERSGHLPSGAWVTMRDGRAWIEASLPRLQFGSNVYPLPVSLLREVLTDLVVEASDVFGFTALDAVDEMAVRRLDLARNFVTSRALSSIIDGLACLPQQASASVDRRGDSNGISGTLVVSTKTAWSCHLYDKYMESRRSAPIGLVRFETRLHRPRLTSQWASTHGGTIEIVGDITGPRVEQLARAMFQHVGFDQAVMSRTEVARRVMADGKLSQHDKYMLIGWLTAHAAGSPGQPSAVTARKYKAEARRLGVSVLPDLPSLPVRGDAVTTRLDWDSGTDLAVLAVVPSPQPTESVADLPLLVGSA